MKKACAILLMSVSLTACLTTEPKLGTVIPLVNGDYEITARSDESSQDALNIALYTAKKECEQYQKRHIVKEKRVGYNGTFDEKTDRMINDTVDYARTASLLLGEPGDASFMLFPDEPAGENAYHEAYLLTECR